MIGIGVTHTSNRPDHLKLFLSQIEKHTKQPYKLHIATDIMNIAKAKNDCLWNLKDCDHIFLFDEDCFPIKDGWIENMIESGLPHLAYLDERHKKFIDSGDGYSYYVDAGGVMMFFTRDCLNKIGYYNSEYKIYGFEHCAVAKRIAKAYGNQFCNISLNNTSDYLYSLDYQGEGNWGVKHKPSITDYKAMQESIDYNRKVFEKEITGDKIYYEYEP